MRWSRRGQLRQKRWFVIIVELGLAAYTVAQCVEPTSANLRPLASQLAREVNALEKDRRPPREGTPAILLRVTEAVTDTAQGSIPSGIATKLRSYLKRNPCPSPDRVERAIRSAGSDQVAFVASSKYADLQEALKRAEEIGPGNIDAGTRNILKQREINYLAVVRLSRRLEREDCAFPLHYGAEVDVVSVESSVERSFAVDDLEPQLNRGPSEDDAFGVELSMDEEPEQTGQWGWGRPLYNYSVDLTIRTSSLPVCLGRARLTLGNTGNKAACQWLNCRSTEEVGCLGPGEERTINVPLTNIPRVQGWYICVQTQDEICDRVCSEDLE